MAWKKRVKQTWKKKSLLEICSQVTMDKSFTHPPFLLLARNLKKWSIEAQSSILKSFWDFIICRWSLNHFDPLLTFQAGNGAQWFKDHLQVKKIPEWFRDCASKLCFLSFWPITKMNYWLPSLTLSSSVFMLLQNKNNFY